MERLVVAFERIDAEKLAEAAEVETHASDLANAVVQGDQAALKEYARHLLSHIQA